MLWSTLAGVAPLWLAAASLVAADEVTYNWDLTWVTASPDGFARPVIGINNAWPCPSIEANQGDTVIVNLNNKLGNQTSGLHFHGIAQINTDEMDGASAATQCAVPPGNSITYKFVVDSAGTYWYHSHNMGQYPDGLRGPLIVHDTSDPYAGKYDEEVVLTLSDWYHQQSLFLMQAMLSPNNSQGLPPSPDSALINEGVSNKITFDKGKTYRVRIISFMAFASAFVHFSGHDMQVIMTDASYVQATSATQIRTTPGQRWDVLLTSTDDSQNFPFLVALDMSPDFQTTAIPAPNATGYLVTNSGADTTATDVLASYAPLDDFTLLPLDNEAALSPAQTFVWNFNLCLDSNSIPRMCFNSTPYINQRVPTLYSVATTGSDNTNPIIYGQVNPMIASAGDVVEIVLNNLQNANHPFHLHGTQFQVVDRGATNAGVFTTTSTSTFRNTPLRRDVVTVNPNSYVVLRFAANNPGVFLLHCHLEWHVEMGLTATLIVGPDKLSGKTFPQDHLDACTAQGLPTSGNANGNSDATDTSGFPTELSPTYTGAMYTPSPSSKLRSRIARFSV